MHQLSVGQTTKQRNVLQQKSITKDQALNFLMQKQLQLMNDEGSGFDALTKPTQSSNLASKDRYLKIGTNVLKQQSPITCKYKFIDFLVSVSVKNSARKKSIYQDQIAIRGLSTTIQNKSEMKVKIQAEKRFRNQTSSRVQTANANLNSNNRRNNLNLYKINIESQKDFNNNSSCENLSYLQEKQTNLNGLKNIRKTRPVTANTSPSNTKDTYSGQYLHQDISDTNIQEGNNGSYLGMTALSNFSKSKQSLNQTSNILTSRLRPASNRMAQSQIFGKRHIIQRNRATFANQINEPSQIMNSCAHLNLSSPTFTQRPISQDARSQSPHKFKVQQHILELSYSLTSIQIQKLFEAKLQDNNLTYQEKSYHHFSNHCLSKCINDRINLQDHYLGQHSAQVLYDIMIINSTLSYCNLSRNKLGDLGVSTIADAISKQNHIIHLNLSNNAFTHRGCQVLFERLQQNESVIELLLDSNEGPNKNLLGPKGAVYIQQYFMFKRDQCILSHLNLKGCGLGNEGIVIISEGLRSNQSLLSLNVRGNQFTRKGLEYLIKRLPRSLEELDISDNDIKDKGVMIICDILYIISQNMFSSNEEEKKVDKQKIKDKYQKMRSIQILDEDYDSDNMPSLSLLNISKCGFTGTQMNFYILVKGLELILSRLMGDGHLKTLIMDQNNFEGKIFTFVEQFLLFNNSLEKISLNDCHIEDQFASHLGQGLLKNLKIKEIYLSHNLIEDEGAKQLSQSLRLNQSLENLKIQQNDIFIEGGQNLAHSMLDNKNIKSIQADNNIFYIRYADQMKYCSKRNLQSYQDQEYPRIIEEKERLSKIKAYKGIFNILKVEVEKEDRSQHDRLASTLTQYKDFKKNVQVRHQYLVQKASGMREALRQKEADLIIARDRELYLEINGDKQIRELLHFSHNFEKDIAYANDDINYHKGKLKDKKNQYSQEVKMLHRELNDKQDKQKCAFLNSKVAENELKDYVKKNNIKKVNNLNVDFGPMLNSQLDFNFKGAKSPRRRQISSKKVSRRGSQESARLNKEESQMIQTQDVRGLDNLLLGEEIKKKKKKCQMRQNMLKPLNFQINMNEVKGLDIELSNKFEVVIKRFQEKLLVVITDGQKFGNVVSASYQRLDENLQDQMMDMDPDLDANQDFGIDKEDEDFNVEFNGQLLLGDRDLQKWLELFAQNLLRSLISLVQFKDIMNILLTFQFTNLKKLDKKKQFEIQRILIDQIKTRCQ